MIAMIPMGLTGKNVSKKPFSEALQAIQQLYENNTKARIAIIYRKELENIQQKIFNFLPREICCFDVLQENRISVLSVEKAKGLEFEHVLVIENNMTSNEEYVSFTRALETLVITKLM